MKNSRIATKILSTSFLIVGLLSFSLLFGCAQEKDTEINTEEATEVNTDEKAPYKINQDGLTYGSALSAESPEDEPDLIAVVITDEEEETNEEGDTIVRAGQEKAGYIYRDDRNALIYASEKDIKKEIAQKGYEMTEDNRGVKIPAYESDGKTLVGEFVVSVMFTES